MLIILFDVDGTLTESRKRIKNNMIQVIKELKNKPSVSIGIVGGSNLDKQKEQLGEDVLSLFDYIFSENGLVAFKNNNLINKTSISDFMGEENIKKLINTCLHYMSTIDIPVKRGTFIEFRNGMINVSPIGRSCSQKERDEFEIFDNEHKVRDKMVKYLKDKLVDLNLSFSIGGQISIDIFPKGWDKTYCLQFIEKDYDRIVFYGDKTMEGGNDHEIFVDNRTESYTVKSPEDTIEKLLKLKW